MASRVLHTKIERWPLETPFRFTGHTWTAIEVLFAAVEEDGHIGCGEAAGVYFLNEKPSVMLNDIEAARAAIESGIDRAELKKILRPGGARNAVDCALWDLEAKLSGQPAWQLAGL